MCPMSKPPSPKRLRLTIAVSPEVHATFQRMADSTGISLGRAMGDWLEDTMEGAQLLTLQLEKARQAPKTAIKEMQAGLHGLQEEMAQLLDDIRTGKRAGPGGLPSGNRAAPAASPRPVIRGGKSSKKVLQDGRGKLL